MYVSLRIYPHLPFWPLGLYLGLCPRWGCARPEKERKGILQERSVGPSQHVLAGAEGVSIGLNSEGLDQGS